MVWLPFLLDTDRPEYGGAVATWTRFLDKFAAQGGTMPQEGGPTFPGANTGQLTMARIDALMQAAALFLTADESDFGWRFLERAWELLWPLARDGAEPSFVRVALVGALLGHASLALSPSGLTLVSPGEPVMRSWNNLDALPETAGVLLAAAAATPGGEIDFDLPSQELLTVMLSSAPEAPVVFFIMGRGSDDAAKLAFAAMHQRYALQLWRMSGGRRRWWLGFDRLDDDPDKRQSLLAPPSPDLIPWPLLALHLGLIRRGIPAERLQSTDPVANECIGFLAEIAHERPNPLRQR